MELLKHSSGSLQVLLAAADRLLTASRKQTCSSQEVALAASSASDEVDRQIAKFMSL